MKTFKVEFFNEFGIRDYRFFHADAVDFDLPDIILSYIDHEFHCDCFTDGTDIWILEEENQIFIWRDIKITEE